VNVQALSLQQVSTLESLRTRAGPRYVVQQCGALMPVAFSMSFVPSLDRLKWPVLHQGRPRAMELVERAMCRTWLWMLPNPLLLHRRLSQTPSTIPWNRHREVFSSKNSLAEVVEAVEVHRQRTHHRS